MPALYPSSVAPEDFKVGECVRKFITESTVTPYLGRVTQIIPATYKVWVQWPFGNSTPEDPEYLIKVNPAIYGMPTVYTDMGYNSVEKSISEKNFGYMRPRITPSRDLTAPVNTICSPTLVINAKDKMAIRVAHTFADGIIGKLVEDISSCKKDGLSDISTYNRIFDKYGSYCSDHIIKASIQKVYEG